MPPKYFRDPEREMDRTHLSLDMAEARLFIHRDYIAHCLRWTHVTKFVIGNKRYERSVVMDVGCGKEMPLAKLLYTSRCSPKKYIGIDINSFEIPEMLMGKKLNLDAWPQTDFTTLDVEDVEFNGKLPNIVVSFEVLEHVKPEHVRRILKKMKELSDPKSNFFISTPCWNGSAAANHINEMKYDALGGLIEDLGFKIENMYGTFASITDYESSLRDRGFGEVFDLLRKYYDSNFLSIIFAPLFPSKSRNVLWHLSKEPAEVRRFRPLKEVEGPWSQSSEWKELAG